MQVARISSSNIRLNNNNSVFSYKNTSNIVNYQQNNTVLYNTMPDMVPFTANKKTSQGNAPEVKSIQEILNEKYPGKPLAEQLMSYHDDLVKERQIGLGCLSKINEPVKNKINDAGIMIKSILEENGIPAILEKNGKSGYNVLFTQTRRYQDNIYDRISKRKYKYTLKSEKYPGAELIISSTRMSMSEMCNSTLNGSRIEEFRFNDFVLKREEEKYFAGYRLNCDLLGKNGWEFIFPWFDKQNNFGFSYGNLTVETPVGLFSGDVENSRNSTKKIEYLNNNALRTLKIEQSTKKNGVIEEFFCLDKGDNHDIQELKYTVHEPNEDTKTHTVKKRVIIEPKKYN